MIMFHKGIAAPCPSVLLHLYDYMIIKMIEIYNIAVRPYYCWHTTSKQSHRTPHLHIYRLKEGASLPAICSTRY